jgi:hypothetical protein
MAAQFDGVNLIITLDAPTNSVLNQTAEQVYDDAKQWHLNANNRKYPFPFTTSGGEDITDQNVAGQYYFLRNDLGWRILTTDADQDVFWDGNLIPTDLTLEIFDRRPGRTIAHLGLQPIVQGLTNLADMHGQIEREIWIDTSLATNGNGYQQSPYNNVTDAIDDAEANNIFNLVLLDDLTLDRQLRNFQIRGIGEPTVDPNNQLLTGCRFTDCQLTGTFNPTDGNSFWHCYFLNGVTGLQGDLHQCGFTGIVSIGVGGTCTIIDGYSLVPGLSRPTIDVGGGGCAVSIRDYRGGLIVTGADNAADEITVSLAMGRLRLDAGNTNGTISCRGICDFENLTAGTTVETSGLVDDIMFGRVIETGFSFESVMRILAAHAAGDVDEPVDGTYAIRDINDTKDRITGTQTANGGRDVTAVDGS